MAALFIIAKKWKQPQRPTTDERIEFSGVRKCISLFDLLKTNKETEAHCLPFREGSLLILCLDLRLTVGCLASRHFHFQLPRSFSFDQTSFGAKNQCSSITLSSTYWFAGGQVF